MAGTNDYFCITIWPKCELTQFKLLLKDVRCLWQSLEKWWVNTIHTIRQQNSVHFINTMK